MREKKKLCDQLAAQISGAVPVEAYDPDEQLRYLTQHVHRQPLEGSARVHLAGKDRVTYEALVAAALPDHPFVRERKLENAVLGSVVLAHAVVNDLLRRADLGTLANLSNQPFLWRSVRKQNTDDSYIDGRYLGYVLASFWNEPIAHGEGVVIRSNDAGLAVVYEKNLARETAILRALLPIAFFGEIRDCDIDVQGKVSLEGRPRGSQRVFEVHGDASIVCDELDVIADSLMLHGNVWVEAEAVTSSPKLEIALKNGTRVGWGGKVSSEHPWKRYEQTLEAPRSTANSDKLTKLVEECTRRLPGALTFNADYSIVDDMRMRWAHRQFGSELPLLVGVLVDFDLASTAKIPVNLVQVHLKVSWGEILEAVRAPTPSTKLKQFVAAARAKINR